MFMTHFSIAKQAIFDTKNEICGYEIFFRENITDNSLCESFDGTFATEKIIIAKIITDMITNSTEGKITFINFTEDLLLSGLAKLLPAESVVIEILETVLPTKEVLEACKELHYLGYKIALDDFVYKDEWQDFFKYVWCIKIDIMQVDINYFSKLKQSLECFKHIIWLAEKIETESEYRLCAEVGFTLFQGFYLHKTSTIENPNNEEVVDNKILLSYQYLQQLLKTGISSTGLLLSLELTGSDFCANHENIKQALKIANISPSYHRQIHQIITNQSINLHVVVFIESIINAIKPEYSDLGYLIGLLYNNDIDNLATITKHELKPLSPICEAKINQILPVLIAAGKITRLFESGLLDQSFETVKVLGLEVDLSAITQQHSKKLEILASLYRINTNLN